MCASARKVWTNEALYWPRMRAWVRSYVVLLLSNVRAFHCSWREGMAEFAKVANRSVKRQKRSADDACSNSKRLRQATDSLTNGSPAVLEDDQNDSFSQFSLTQNGDTGHTDQPENGIVESLELRNFMCHQNLKINFGEKINFVIGKNGSKSTHFTIYF